MAEKKTTKPKKRLIDPIYKKFTEKAFKTMTSSEFFEYFMAMMANGNHNFQFTNRKVDKQVDERWVLEVENCLPALEEISKNPRVIITLEELVTNVVLVKQVTPQVVRHLCAHGNLVESINDKGEVIPSKLLNSFKEDTWDTYENRFVYTLLEKTYHFVDIRYQKLFEVMDGEFGAHLKMDSTGATSLEDMELKVDMRIRQKDDLLDTDEKHETIFSRIARIHRLLTSLLNTQFAQEVSKYPRVKPPLVPTNAIKKNPHLRKCHKLWDFLLAYQDVGYTIEIIEQNPEIDTKFEQDIFDNIMFTYIILKGYLEDARDREVDYKVKAKKKKLKPKYIKEIIEEMVKDYNLPDVEVRKVLIEELTKAQLMEEEEAERLRLVEEKEREMKEKKRQEELEKARIEKEKEKERRRLEREKEREKQRKLKEAQLEKERIQKEKERKEQADLRKGQLFAEELEKQAKNIELVINARKKRRQMEEEQRLREEKARLAAEEKARKEAEEKARLAEEKAKLAAEKKARKEAEAEAKRLTLARQKAEETARAVAEETAKVEAERLAMEERARQEEERIRQEEEARIKAQEKLKEEKALAEAAKLREEALEEAAKLREEELRREEKLKELREQQEELDRKQREAEARTEERMETEFFKIGVGRGKNQRVKKKLEKQYREKILHEELIRVGLLEDTGHKTQAAVKPQTEKNQDVNAEDDKSPVINEEDDRSPDANAEDPKAETQNQPVEEKRKIRSKIGKQWNKWFG